MGTTVLMDTSLSGVQVAVDLTTLEVQGAARTLGTSQIELDFSGAAFPRGLTVRFEPTDPQVLKAWTPEGMVAFDAIEKAIEQNRLGAGEVLFGNVDLASVRVEKR